MTELQNLKKGHRYPWAVEAETVMCRRYSDLLAVVAAAKNRSEGAVTTVVVGVGQRPDFTVRGIDEHQMSEVHRMYGRSQNRTDGDENVIIEKTVQIGSRKPLIGSRKTYSVVFLKVISNSKVNHVGRVVQIPDFRTNGVSVIGHRYSPPEAVGQLSAQITDVAATLKREGGGSRIALQHLDRSLAALANAAYMSGSPQSAVVTQLKDGTNGKISLDQVNACLDALGIKASSGFRSLEDRKDHASLQVQAPARLIFVKSCLYTLKRASSNAYFVAELTVAGVPEEHQFWWDDALAPPPQKLPPRQPKQLTTGRNLLAPTKVVRKIEDLTHYTAKPVCEEGADNSLAAICARERAAAEKARQDKHRRANAPHVAPRFVEDKEHVSMSPMYEEPVYTLAKGGGELYTPVDDTPGVELAQFSPSDFGGETVHPQVLPAYPNVTFSKLVDAPQGKPLVGKPAKAGKEKTRHVTIAS